MTGVLLGAYVGTVWMLGSAASDAALKRMEHRKPAPPVAEASGWWNDPTRGFADLAETMGA